MDEARQHVAIFDVEVVVRPKDIGRDDGGEGTAMLLEVGPVEAQCLLILPRNAPLVSPIPSEIGFLKVIQVRRQEGLTNPRVHPPLSREAWARPRGSTCSARQSSSWHMSTQNCCCEAARCGSGGGGVH